MEDRFLTRYYDTRTQQMVKLNTIVNTCENGKDIEFYGICISGNGQISQVELDKNPVRFKRMSCTGLKAKNGKLIYEGDILKYPDLENAFKSEYAPQQPKIIIEYFSFRLMAYVTGMDEYQDLDGWTNGDENTPLEIIGNIYENQELLEVQND